MTPEPVWKLREIPADRPYGPGVFLPPWLRGPLFTILERLGLRPLLGRLHRRWLFGPAGLAAGRDILRTHRSAACLFNVSFHRCATRSVAFYLGDLGTRSLHFPDFAGTGFDYESIAAPVSEDRLAVLCALAPLLWEFQCFSDVPYPGLYRELSEELPQSRFLLVTRPLEDWWQSVVQLLGLQRGPRRLTPFEAIQYGLPRGTEVSLDSEALLCGLYLQHNRDVVDWFAGSGRLLAAELQDPEIGIRIANFVGLPPQPFPHQGESPRVDASRLRSQRAGSEPSR